MHKLVQLPVVLNSNNSVLQNYKSFCVCVSAVVEDRFLSRHVGSNFIPTSTSQQNNGQEINAVMFRPKSKRSRMLRSFTSSAED